MFLVPCRGFRESLKPACSLKNDLLVRSGSSLYSQELADALDIGLAYGSGMAQSQLRFFGLLTHEVRSASLAAHDLA